MTRHPTPLARTNPRRRALMKWAALSATLPAAGTAGAAGFPDKSVKVVVPYGPGGGTDNLMRMLAPALTESLGQTLVIENKPGGASVIGTDLVAKSPPDGYTLLASDLALLVNPGLFPKLPFDTVKDLAGVTMMATAPVLLVVHPSVPAKNLQELLAMARAKPGSMNYASGGNGASTHLAGELMKIAAKVDIVHIPYKGTAPAMNDLLAGQVQMQFAGISTAKQHVESGRLRAIAMTGPKRNQGMPDVPTFIEQGLEGVDADTWWGLYAPSATPADVIARLNKDVTQALRSPALADRLTAAGYVPIANSPAEHTAMMRSMIQRWTDVIKQAGIKMG
ncbi:MAG: tripartite tricarboxylate transporter substrate binding protein [Lautropia sp.]